MQVSIFVMNKVDHMQCLNSLRQIFISNIVCTG